MWCKSDPGTTAVYDRETVDYIVNSDEGMKYYRFFRAMLVGSEEHYFASLLFNWKRTRDFVRTFDAVAVWNTWKHGVVSPQEANVVFDNTKGHKANVHTLFISINELAILQGLRALGVFFARKITSSAVDLLNIIDSTFVPGSEYDRKVENNSNGYAHHTW